MLSSLGRNVLSAREMPPFASSQQRDHLGSGNGEPFIVQKISFGSDSEQKRNQKQEKYNPGKQSVGLFLSWAAEILLHTGYVLAFY